MKSSIGDLHSSSGNRYWGSWSCVLRAYIIPRFWDTIHVKTLVFRYVSKASTQAQAIVLCIFSYVCHFGQFGCLTWNYFQLIAVAVTKQSKEGWKKGQGYLLMFLVILVILVPLWVRYLNLVENETCACISLM